MGPKGSKSYGAEQAGLKRCSKCNELKPQEAFAAHAGCLDGLQSNCRACHLKYVYAYEANNEECVKAKRRSKENRAYGKAYYWDNREKALAKSKAYYQANKERLLENQRRKRNLTK